MKYYTLKVFLQITLVMILMACSSVGNRPHYSRTEGGYRTGSDNSKEKASINYRQDNSKYSQAKKGRGSKKQNRIKKVADSYLGVPYRWGGKSRGGMDCSGFVKTVFAKAMNLKLPHSSKVLSKQGKKISKKNLRLGDLVFFGNFLGVDHVGIYIGAGEFIHASTSRGVMYSKLSNNYFNKRYKWSRRIL